MSELRNRIEYAKQQLEHTLQILNADSPLPIWASAKESLEKMDSNRVHEFWEKALARVEVDPEGSITASRAFLESVFKYILSHSSRPFRDTDDLPKLYSAAAEALQLLPSQWDEKLFKQILGGAHSAVDGIAALRNRYGDAHGKTHEAAIARPRHARLAVNMAGAIACFFVETWEARLEYNGDPLPRWFHDEKNLELAQELIAQDLYDQQMTDFRLEK